MSKLRCFVAMAFEREDTDVIYDNHIVPVLKKNKVTPVRIDRIEHNENVDIRILEEIKRCDFAVADLTYARPSVYFEAGYAQREVPVIYTCRRDHFHAKEEDLYGNLQIHFDLKMKNIVAWNDSYDDKFDVKLAKRLTIVTRPLLRKLDEIEKRRKEVKQFNSKSFNKKVNLLSDIIKKQIGRSGFKYQEAGYFPENILSNIPIRGEKFVNENRYAICFWIANSFTKRSLSDIHERWNFFAKPFQEFEYSNVQFKRLIECLVFCSIDNLPVSRLKQAFKDFRYDDVNKVFIKSNRRASKWKEYSRKQFVYTIDKIECEGDFSTRLKKVIGKFRSER